MFRKQRDLIFIENKEKYIPLHMFFVFYCIDVVYLNKKKEVVELKENFFPFTIYAPKRKAQYVLELKQKTICTAEIKVGDVLDFLI